MAPGRRGWIRLWQGGLNLHFGAQTDLFNFWCAAAFQDSLSRSDKGKAFK